MVRRSAGRSGSAVRLIASLPRGEMLSPEVWGARHHFMQVVLWSHVPFLFVVGLANGMTVGHATVEVGLVAVMALSGHLSSSRTLRSMSISLGLLTSSGVLVHLTGGLIESHFHFFVILPLVALYQDWRPFLTALAFVLFHHGIVGLIDPASVYNHPAALASPLKWAVVHAAYVLGLVAVLVFHWRFAERAEYGRRESEERFSASFDAAPIGMSLISLDGRFIQVNRSFAELVGRSVADLGGMGFADITHPDDLAASFEAVDQLLNGGPPRLLLQKRYVKADGTVIWARVGGSMVTDHRGRPLYMIAQVEDVTERKEQRERLEDLVRSKDEFVASVSHELRTPLTAVVGSTQLLRENRGLSDDDKAELVDLLASQSMEVANIVEDLLVAARSDIGTVAIAPRLFSLTEAVNSVIAALPATDRLRVRVDEIPEIVWADPARVRQILRNLLSNAVRYGGSRIMVRAATGESCVRLEVCDDGPQIPVDQQARIFEPYERAHEAGSQPGSVGLGLTISRQLARLMDGDLAYSWVEGQSMFVLNLPCAESQAAAVA
jgi:PAS domain S-box-containing protein